MSEFNAVNRKAKMSDEMQQYAVECATFALKKHLNHNANIAEYIRQEFLKKYNGKWNCFVGPTTCAWAVSHDNMCYINFEMGEKGIVLFKSG